MVADDPESFADLDGHAGAGVNAEGMWLENRLIMPESVSGPSEEEEYLNGAYTGFVLLDGQFQLMVAGQLAQLRQQQAQAQNLIVVGDPGLGEHNQGENFNRAAQTRAEELEGQGQKVTVVRASSVDDFASALKNNGTLSGVEYFGHASWDRLYVGETSAHRTNIDSSNVGKLSGANLTSNATVAIHACFAGSGGSDSIAGQISHQLGRKVTAYDGPTIFSSSPKGPTGGRYPPSSGPLYLVPDRRTNLVTFP